MYLFDMPNSTRLMSDQKYSIPLPYLRDNDQPEEKIIIK